MLTVYFNRSFSATSHHIQALRESWAGPPLRVIISHSAEDPHLMMVADHFEVEPEPMSEGAYLEYTLEMCARHHVDVFYPRKYAERLVRHAARFEDLKVKVAFVGDAEVYALFDDKLRACDELERRGLIPSPPRALVRTLDELTSAYERIRSTPLGRERGHETVCLKPNVGIGGKGFMRISHRRTEGEDLFRESLHSVSYERLKRAYGLLSEPPELLLSTYLEGDEYSVDCLGDHGVLLAAYPRVYVSKHEQRFDHVPELIELCRAICAHYKLSYHFNVQVKRHRGRWYFIELNTRWAAGSHRVTALSVTPFVASLQLLTGGEVSAPLEIEWGRSVRRVERYEPLEP